MGQAMIFLQILAELHLGKMPQNNSVVFAQDMVQENTCKKPFTYPSHCPTVPSSITVPGV